MGVSINDMPEPTTQSGGVSMSDMPEPQKEGTDLAEQAGVGVYRGVTALAGTAGDIGRAMTSGIENQSPGAQAFGFAQPVASALSSLPGTSDIRESAELFTGHPPPAENDYQKWAGTAGEFFPMAFGGGAGFFSRVARVLTPASTSFGAKKGAETLGVGEQGQEWAAFAGAMTPATLMFMMRQAPELMEGASQQLRKFADANYNHPDVTGLKIKVPVVQGQTLNIIQDLYSQGFREETAKGTARALNDLMFPKVPVIKSGKISYAPQYKTVVDYNDIAAVRQQLKDIGQNFNDPIDRKWATSALHKIDEWLPKLQQGDLVAGDAQKAGMRLLDARSDYWAHKSLDLLGKKLYQSIYGAGSTYSGQNLENKVRQRINSILQNDKARSSFTKDEIALMERAVKPGGAEQLMRRIEKMLPRHGFMSTILNSIGIGASAHTGNPLYAMGPVVGQIAGSIENKLANKLVREIQSEIIERSAAYRSGQMRVPQAPRKDLFTPAAIAHPFQTQKFDQNGNPVEQ